MEFQNKYISDIDKLTWFRIQKLLPVNSIKIIETHIVDHCNLNCKGCHHFAPLAPESFISLTEFKSDLTRLYELTADNIDTFNILGGEPLLHPQCAELLEAARKIFPNSKLKLITNGILLPKMSDDFYEKLGKNNILLQPTYYGLDIDWEIVKSKCLKYGVDFRFYLNNELMYKDAIDLSNSQNATNSYLNCQLGWHETFYLDHGKIYHCSKEAYLRFFSDYFNKDIKVPESDYIDIYKVKNIQEIFDFMIKPPQFCSHCAGTIGSLPYKREASKKEINEWI